MAAAARDAIGHGKLEEIGIIELDVEITPLMIAVLDVLDCAIGRVVVHECNHPQAVADGGGELLGGHQEAAIAADDGDRPAAERDRGTDGRREAPSRA